jgi:hypothetical protein
MDYMNKKEIKIFLTFFIIYSFFVFWIGWNEQSHFALTRAIVDEGKLDIDSFANQTSDRAFYNGHYYSDKDPGLSFLAVPIYASWRFIYNFFPNDFKEKYVGANESIITKVGENNTPVVDYVNPGFFILISMILLTVFTSSLVSALTIILIYKISKYFTKNENYRLFLIIIAGLGTLLFPYALVFMKHATETFFAFLSFYLLFKAKQEKIKENKYFVLSGLSIGFAMSCSITIAIIGIACLAYLISFKREKIFYFVIGGLVGILPFILYNYFVFGIPFTLSRYYMDPKIWPELGGIYGLNTPNLFVILRLTFDPYKGLFFYYPILLLSLIGLYYMYKKFKIESFLIVFIFFAFLLMNSSWWAWWGGTCFGPRHLTPIIPFLVLPLLYIFEKFYKNKILKIIILSLIFYSIIVNFSGLQPMGEEIIDVKTNQMASQYKEKVNTFQIIKNPLYETYIPLFLRDGPRNRIFENLVNSIFPIDIRFFLQDQREAFSSLYFNIPFLSLLPVIIIISFIWWKGIRNFILIHKYKIMILSIFCIFFILLFLLRQSKEETIFSKGWYPQAPNEDGRWMKEDGILNIFNTYDTKKTLEISAHIISYFKTRKVEIYLNNKLITDLTIQPSKRLEYSILITDVYPGINVLKIHSLSNCDIPIILENNENDTRCETIYVSNISLKYFNETYTFSKGWYPQAPNEDLRWTSGESTITLYNTEKTTKLIKFTATLRKYSKNRDVNLFLNDNFIKNITLGNEDLNYEEFLELNPGENILRFYSNSKCDTPLSIEGIEDTRCLNFGIKNIMWQTIELPITFDSSYLNKWNKGSSSKYLPTFNNNTIELNVGYCNATSWIEKNILIPEQSSSLKIDLCTGYSGGDGTSAVISIDDYEGEIFIPNNSCTIKSFDVKKFSGDFHNIKIMSSIFGICSGEGSTINYIQLTDEKSENELELSNNLLFNLTNYLEQLKWLKNGIKDWMPNYESKIGIELNVGYCDAYTSIERNITITSNIKSLKVDLCTGYSGGDGTSSYLYIDKKRAVIFSSSNSCNKTDWNIEEFADNKEHLIKIQSYVFGICKEEMTVVKDILLTTEESKFYLT